MGRILPFSTQDFVIERADLKGPCLWEAGQLGWMTALVLKKCRHIETEQCGCFSSSLDFKVLACLHLLISTEHSMETTGGFDCQWKHTGFRCCCLVSRPRTHQLRIIYCFRLQAQLTSWVLFSQLIRSPLLWLKHVLNYIPSKVMLDTGHHR